MQKAESGSGLRRIWLVLRLGLVISFSGWHLLAARRESVSRLVVLGLSGRRLLRSRRSVSGGWRSRITPRTIPGVAVSGLRVRRVSRVLAGSGIGKGLRRRRVPCAGLSRGLVVVLLRVLRRILTRPVSRTPRLPVVRVVRLPVSGVRRMSARLTGRRVLAHGLSVRGMRLHLARMTGQRRHRLMLADRWTMRHVSAALLRPGHRGLGRRSVWQRLLSTGSMLLVAVWLRLRSSVWGCMRWLRCGWRQHCTLLLTDWLTGRLLIVLRGDRRRGVHVCRWLLLVTDMLRDGRLGTSPRPIRSGLLLMLAVMLLGDGRRRHRLTVRRAVLLIHWRDMHVRTVLMSGQSGGRHGHGVALTDRRRVSGRRSLCLRHGHRIAVWPLLWMMHLLVRHTGMALRRAGRRPVSIRLVHLVAGRQLLLLLWLRMRLPDGLTGLLLLLVVEMHAARHLLLWLLMSRPVLQRMR